MKGIKEALGIGALVLALSGCQDKLKNGEFNINKEIPKNGEFNIKEFNINKEIPKNGEFNINKEIYTRPVNYPCDIIDAHKELEGRIIKVQPSQFSYAYGAHEFEYVIVEGKDRKLHTLIYPFSKAILERNAVIEFRPVKSWPKKCDLSVKKFIDIFLNPNYYMGDNFPIEAEGIIKRDGITYKK